MSNLVKFLIAIWPDAVSWIKGLQAGLGHPPTDEEIIARLPIDAAKVEDKWAAWGAAHPLVDPGARP